MDKIQLSGVWKFGFADAENKQSHPDVFCCTDTIELPSTTEISGKGSYGPEPEQTLHLSRKYPFTGKAYYEREVAVPEEWKGSRIFLCLERTKYTEIFVDGRKVSWSHETLIPQRHDLTEAFFPGAGEPGGKSDPDRTKIPGVSRRLGILVDNDLAQKADFPESLLRGHQYTDHTQTNWNGILGQIYLERADDSLWSVPQILGDWDRKGFRIRAKKGRFLTVKGRRSDGMALPEKRLECSLDSGRPEAFYPLQEPVCWDEFSPVFYELQITVTDEQGRQQHYVQRAGMRQLRIADRKIWINGTPVFLRGTVDCCIYPKTGACPMEAAEWHNIFQTFRSYGLNHCRFHSWCPPEEAFRAADEIGMYLQVELSNFGNALCTEGNPGRDPVLQDYIWDQAEKVLRQYGNHPSFLLFAVGNEMTGELEEYERLIRHLRRVREDKLYTQGANNFLEHPRCSSADDCWIMMRTDETTNIRASFSHGDLPLGYLQTEEEPSTLHDYKKGVEQSPLPLISHEIGQYQCYPDYREIEKYTGPLSPENLKIFQKRLQDAGLGQFADRFFQASGRLAVQCYREEIEAALRTEGMAGFQLLGLSDFPGQGTALVGILDSFLDSKGLVSPEEFRRFCQEQVLLACFSGYVWQENEIFRAEILCANFGKADRDEPVRIRLCGEDGRFLAEKTLSGQALRGRLSRLGSVEILLPPVKQAECVKLTLSSGELENSYPLWLYRGEPDSRSYDRLASNGAGENGRQYYDRGVRVTDRLDLETMEWLKKGGTAALFSDRVTEERSVPGFFAPDFWCYPMFRQACLEKGLPVAPGTLGMVCDKNHPVFRGFPTEDYAQWQWQTLLYHSRPVILDGWGQDIIPIVQIIDNFDRNHRLGFLFEMRIRQGGRLLFCAGNVLGRVHRPQVRQFLESAVNYAASPQFQPVKQVELEDIVALF